MLCGKRGEKGGISIEEKEDSGPSLAGNRANQLGQSSCQVERGGGRKIQPRYGAGQEGGFLGAHVFPSPSLSVQPKRTVGNLNVGYFWPSRLIDRDWIVAA